MDILKHLDIERLSQGKDTIQDCIKKWCDKYTEKNPDLILAQLGFFCIWGASS